MHFSAQEYIHIPFIPLIDPPGQAQPDKSIYYATSVSDLEVGCSVNKYGNPDDNTFIFIQTDHPSYTLSSETGKTQIDISSEARDGDYMCYAKNHPLLYGENGTFAVVVTGTFYIISIKITQPRVVSFVLQPILFILLV